jgi:hypothetical protein
MRTMALTLAVTFLAATAVMAADCCPPAACEQPQACCPAQDCCGPACHQACVQKYCQVVCTTKKIKKTIWAVKCEDFCPQMPRGLCNPCGMGCGLIGNMAYNLACGQGCGTECGACEPGCCEASCCDTGCCDPCASLRCRPECPPGCGNVRTKKKLLRKVIECEVPAYKCVVVCCGQACCDPGCCDAGCGAAGPVEEEDAAPAEAPAPTEATTGVAPLPPIVGTSYLKALTP